MEFQGTLHWDILHTNDYLTIQLVENISSENIVPADLPLNIVYEDEESPCNQ